MLGIFLIIVGLVAWVFDWRGKLSAGNNGGWVSGSAGPVMVVIGAFMTFS